MPDIAALGIEVDSSGVPAATQSLNQLTGAAARAEAATQGLEIANQGASGAAAAAAAAFAKETSAASALSSRAGQLSAALSSMRAKSGGIDLMPRLDSSQISAMSAALAGVERTSLAAAKALASESLAAQRASTEAARFNAVANDNAPIRSAAHNVANLAAQFQDIGVTAAMGMNPLQIALQQGTQIAAVLGPMGAAGAVQSLGHAFLSVISPVSLAVIGIVALAAALLQFVNWSKLGAAALNGLADILVVIAPYAVAAAAGLALLYAPAIIGGIVSLIALTGRLTVQVLALAAAWIVANPATAFILGLVAVVAAMNIFRDELKNIFGRDIVADVKNSVNFIIGAFVGAFNGIKAVWSSLPAVMGDVIYQAANATVKGVEAMLNSIIQKFDAFNKRVYDAISYAASFTGATLPEFKGIGAINLGGVDNPYAGSLSGAADSVSKAIKDAQGTDYVGQVTSVIEKGASAASAKLKELAANLLKVDAAKSKKSAAGKTDSEKYSDIVDGANRSIAALRAEQAAVGMSAEAASKLKHETELLNQAQQKGIVLTDAQRTELSGLAATMASVETATADAKANLALAKDSATGFLSTLRQGLVSGAGWWKSFGDAALSVLDKIASAIETKLVDSLFTSGAGGFNILSLFGLGASVASGGASVGAGAVAASASPAGRPIAASRAPVRMSGGAPNGGQQGVHITWGFEKDADGNITPQIKKIAQGEIMRHGPRLAKVAIDDYRANRMSRDVNGVLSKPRKRGEKPS